MLNWAGRSGMFLAKYSPKCYNKEKEGRLQIFKLKVFAKFAKRELINDDVLCEAVERAEKGLIDASLGGCVIKQRVGREGQGRSKGHRVLIAVRLKKRYVFMDGFAKSEKENINDDELDAIKTYGLSWLNADENSIKSALKDGKLLEVKYEKKN